MPVDFRTRDKRNTSRRLEVPLVRGRWFDDSDRAETHRGGGGQRRAGGQVLGMNSDPDQQAIPSWRLTVRG